MELQLSSIARTDAIASLKRYFDQNLQEPIGDLADGLLLHFIVQDIGPSIYNQAVADAQTRLQQRVADLSGELYAQGFPYWPNQKSKKSARMKHLAYPPSTIHAISCKLKF